MLRRLGYDGNQALQASPQKKLTQVDVSCGVRDVYPNHLLVVE